MNPNSCHRLFGVGMARFPFWGFLLPGQLIVIFMMLPF